MDAQLSLLNFYPITITSSITILQKGIYIGFCAVIQHQHEYDVYEEGPRQFQYDKKRYEILIHHVYGRRRKGGGAYIDLIRPQL